MDVSVDLRVSLAGDVFTGVFSFLSEEFCLREEEGDLVFLTSVAGGNFLIDSSFNFLRCWLKA
jgi:hypothetical protein